MRGEDPAPRADHAWFDGDAGPVVRPYALTGGRGRPATTLDLVAHVVRAEVTQERTAYLPPEHLRILDLTREPMSVAEVASRLNLALGVVRVMLGDLLAEGLVTVSEPPAAGQAADAPTLEAVINGLRAL
jgi:hypothetical protein